MKHIVNDRKLAPLIMTIGHSNVSGEKLLSLLKSAQIQTVIDCRSRPRSRWAQFNGSNLSASLLENQINYEWRGTNIGGMDQNVLFDETLDELAERAAAGECMALLCSEGRPKDCHRGTILTPKLVERGVHIKHLLYDNPQRALI